MGCVRGRWGGGCGAWLAVLVVCAWSQVCWGRTGIVGSAHDWSSRNWSGKQICLPCHIPHNAMVKDASGNAIEGPLWNHTLPTNNYTLYTAANTPKGKDASGQPILNGKVDQNSLLCLSCHDGTVALGAYGGSPNPYQEMSNDSALVGLNGDLSDDHPMGEAAVWPGTTPDYLVDPSQRDAQGIMPLRKMANGQLAVGCTSCHEPHNRMGVEHLLWAPVRGAGTTVDGRAVGGSVLCMNCHKK